jgi:hypothetical protein
MSRLTDELYQLRQNDPDVALVLDAYEEIDRVYAEIIEAMGGRSKPATEIMNSANVTISFRATEVSG